MAISELEFIGGLFSLIYVLISTLIGLLIASKYLKIKRPIFLLMGLTWIFMACPWWPSSISFLLALLTGQGLNFVTYVIIGNATVPIFVMLLTTSMSELLYKERQKRIFAIFAVYGVIIEIYLFYYIIVDPSALGTLNGIVDIEYSGVLRYYLISVIILIVVVGILIARPQLKSDNPELRLKGKLLLIAYILWPIGAFADAALPLNVITLPIIRIILISSSMFFYIGFILPKFIKKMFLKEE